MKIAAETCRIRNGGGVTRLLLEHHGLAHIDGVLRLDGATHTAFHDRHCSLILAIGTLPLDLLCNMASRKLVNV